MSKDKEHKGITGHVGADFHLMHTVPGFLEAKQGPQGLLYEKTDDTPYYGGFDLDKLTTDLKTLWDDIQTEDKISNCDKGLNTLVRAIRLLNKLKQDDRR